MGVGTLRAFEVREAIGGWPRPTADTARPCAPAAPGKHGTPYEPCVLVGHGWLNGHCWGGHKGHRGLVPRRAHPGPLVGCGLRTGTTPSSPPGPRPVTAAAPETAADARSATPAALNATCVTIICITTISTPAGPAGGTVTGTVCRPQRPGTPEHTARIHSIIHWHHVLLAPRHAATNGTKQLSFHAFNQLQ